MPDPGKMPKRPAAITGLCWLLISGVLVNVYSVLMLFQNREFLENVTSGNRFVLLQLGVGSVGLVVMLVSSIAMLLGKNWGRYLLATWTIIVGVGVLIGRQLDLITLLAFLFSALILAVLFRKESNEYFKVHRGKADVDLSGAN
ncbi:hypothetical protein LOC67_17070 [Stieleria sp. JC731]|uniref:hypothetical protein n=1 Tax=Pirellulaceae TaxID=2691357 RepID=UPI001E527B47|nr:hypothetical protein [Stieleria sp. JC731]MCC9602268.1 hypothetical protein [Stieleria sp. JC731]